MHPFTENRRDIILTATSALSGVALLTLLSEKYSNPHNLLCTITASVSYTLIFSLSAYYWWYLKQYLKTLAAKAAFAMLVQLASTASASIILILTDSCGPEWFYRMLPVIIPIGILCWIIISQMYSLYNCAEPEELAMLTPVVDIEKSVQETISVKEGNRLHIIRAENLHYIQAYGDYTMLFTNEGKFVKEETMKHFEVTLPGYFVRIHRSTIVNTRMVVKTELYGKESYTIHLSTGVTLRSSAGGYKLLKTKLSLN